ncbi:TetR/AcrR family transcriptional regulator [Halalkalibacter okhensis]|uniref:TetR family transcriptional regulator n=1 Tax=Halalkalibacter okhensis TaxID=333138 RepID=A0A0B0IH37_9BACI|nr:TetR/AcrR family transcriptional regulator [Halalkalibacter okhensis]KHF38981.1 TetR family transcriptional regulator [Halalkalibacter okhensis]
MNDRKQHVIKMAHQLFINKGFQATSIQDILEYSGISKGTFYNYFSSKNELLKALFKSIYKKMEKDRNELLIGQDPSDIEILIKQFELQLNTNKKNKLFTLFEEVLISSDVELKQYFKEGQLRMLRWTYQRFLEIFGEDKKPYLLDCAIMFLGILHQNMKYYAMGHDHTSIEQVVRYTVNRIEKIVYEVAVSNEQLNEPELLDKWLPDQLKSNSSFHKNLNEVVVALKKNVSEHKDQPKYLELLDFVQDEVVHPKPPRRFLIESALISLNEDPSIFNQQLLSQLEQLVTSQLQKQGNK